MSAVQKLKAREDKGLIIEPIKEGYSKEWEGHHATNPCAIRFSCDPRVFLGYRAGGDADFHYCGNFKTWGSHLGMAVLDERGEKVVNRFPLPIFRLVHDIALPQSPEEGDAYREKHKDDIVILHDFRFLEYQDYLYMIYHEGPVEGCVDSVVRMPVKLFLEKIEESIRLSAKPLEEIMEDWHQLWWTDDLWEPCGYNGTKNIWASEINKGDVIFFELADGTLQLCHRPLAFGVAVLNTGNKVYAEPTEDGLTRYGVYETNVRPGYEDNSHLGNNGMPTRAKIGDVDVYIDVTHGCYSELIASKSKDTQILYYPYFRVKDYNTGELLYYSDAPIIDYGSDWDAYSIGGEWVSGNDPLKGVMFAGGQYECIPGKNGLDDEFVTYIGMGDTTVATAHFTLRELLPAEVINDIISRGDMLAKPVEGIDTNCYEFDEKVNGWQWRVENDTGKRIINIVRTLEKDGSKEDAVREINSRPGYFDADGVVFDGKSIRYVEEIGAWALVYRGLRMEEKDGSQECQIGYGLLMLDPSNLERVLYRSIDSIKSETADSWSLPACSGADDLLDNFKEHVPAKVIKELINVAELRKDNMPTYDQMTKWQCQKSGESF